MIAKDQKLLSDVLYAEQSSKDACGLIIEGAAARRAQRLQAEGFLNVIGYTQRDTRIWGLTDKGREIARTYRADVKAVLPPGPEYDQKIIKLILARRRLESALVAERAKTKALEEEVAALKRAS